MERQFPNGAVLRLVTGDITKIRVDAVVNAANSALAGGGGVDGAIHRAGGPGLFKELQQVRQECGPCPPGNAVVTSAGELPAKYVFHAVGPIYRGGRQGEAQQLASCYRTCLRLAEARKVKTISFPAISTGAYGYPLHEAAAIALAEISKHLEDPAVKVREVLVVLWDPAAFEAHSQALSAMQARM